MPISISTLTGLILSLAVLGAAAQPLPDNPLPPCPESPNCERVSQYYEVPDDTLFAAAQASLDELGPSELTVDPGPLRAHAVYRVALVFDDDVHLAVEPHADGSVLHIRSASRVGYSDLGVNQRRVERFLEALDDQLATL